MNKVIAGLIAAACCALAAPATAQDQGRPSEAARTPQAAATIDLTGNWVSIVTEDWRWRMVAPAKGDYASVPLTPEGVRVADQWDPALDQASGNQCKAYGVGGVMRMPGRLRIAWADPARLRVETDAGTQTRLLLFSATESATASRERTWQGNSRATWDGPAANSDGPRGGELKVVTTGMRAGYLRRNGVPYSENAVVTEYFHVLNDTGGDQWLVVTTLVEDPTYLFEPFMTSTHFKKEPDGAKWAPTPCS